MKSFSGTWLPSTTSYLQTYKQACKDIVSNDLKDFKKYPPYTQFIANDVRDQIVARAFYNHLKYNAPVILGRYKDEFSINDKIGNSNIYNFDGINVSPGTLRFMKVIGDIIPMSGSIKKIIEIGSGYGGQCLAFKVYDPEIDYTLLDIPESLAVADLYLKKNKIQHQSISSDNVQITEEYDLCISDYCLSEFDEVGVQFYLTNVLSRCKYAYITTNSIGQSLSKLMTQLSSIFSVTRISAEEPKTSPHSNYIIMCKQ